MRPDWLTTLDPITTTQNEEPAISNLWREMFGEGPPDLRGIDEGEWDEVKTAIDGSRYFRHGHRVLHRAGPTATVLLVTDTGAIAPSPGAAETLDDALNRTAHDAVRCFLRDLDEARAELAAFKGRPEGAINDAWTWDGYCWGRDIDALRSMCVEFNGSGEVIAYLRDETIDADAAHDDDNEINIPTDDSATPRTAMRACEVAAKARGWNIR